MQPQLVGGHGGGVGPAQAPGGLEATGLRVEAHRQVVVRRLQGGDLLVVWHPEGRIHIRRGGKDDLPEHIVWQSLLRAVERQAPHQRQGQVGGQGSAEKQA